MFPSQAPYFTVRHSLFTEHSNIWSSGNSFPWNVEFTWSWRSGHNLCNIL